MRGYRCHSLSSGRSSKMAHHAHKLTDFASRTGPSSPQILLNANPREKRGYDTRNRLRAHLCFLGFDVLDQQLFDVVDAFGHYVFRSGRQDRKFAHGVDAQAASLPVRVAERGMKKVFDIAPTEGL